MSALDLMARRLDDYMWREHGVCIGKAATVAALDNIALPALLAKSAAHEALVAELATERDLHNRIARNFDHYSKEWVALKDAVEAAPIGTVVAGRANSYGGYHVEIAHDQGWASGQRVRLLLVREGGDGN